MTKTISVEHIDQGTSWEQCAQCVCPEVSQLQHSQQQHQFKRRFRLRVDAPLYLLKLCGMTNENYLEIEEKIRIDHDQRRIMISAKNVNHPHIVKLTEKVTYEQHPERNDWISLRIYSKIQATSIAFNIDSYIENSVLTNYIDSISMDTQEISERRVPVDGSFASCDFDNEEEEEEGEDESAMMDEEDIAGNMIYHVSVQEDYDSDAIAAALQKTTTKHLYCQ